MIRNKQKKNSFSREPNKCFAFQYFFFEHENLRQKTNTTNIVMDFLLVLSSFPKTQNNIYLKLIEMRWQEKME